MKNERYVIFGASGGGIKVAKTLRNLGIEFAYFVDNDSKKWGTYWEDKLIKSPDDLLEDDARIIIASDYQSEIEKQLDGMGILNRLVLKEELIMDYVDTHIEEFDYVREATVVIGNEKPILFGLEEGLVLGGIESWTFMLARELKRTHKNVRIITKKTEDQEPQDLKENITFIDLEYSHYWQSIHSLVKMIVDCAPCIVIDSWQNQFLMAVSIVKRLKPELVKCISVVHNDKIQLYRKTGYMQQYIDVITGVTKIINLNMQEQHGVAKEKWLYKELPVEGYTVERKIYSKEGEPLQIGYAARITKVQKRADLIVPLLLELNKRGVNYIFHIAGNGNYYDKLIAQIEENHLQHNVVIHGNIPRNLMEQYWSTKDVFVNLSDFEGPCLSMLESMSSKAVPVVTKVSGSIEFVEHGKNGFISETGKVIPIAENLEYIDRNRHVLKEMGELSSAIVLERCRKEDYVAFFNELIL